MRLEGRSPEVTRRLSNVPTPVEVVQPEDFSFIKRKDSARSE